MPHISKSKYIAGLQCSKLLWNHYNARYRFPPIDASTQWIFDQGHEIGRIAQRLVPNGVEVAHGSFTKTIGATATLLPKRQPIYEASFAAAGVYCRVDILEPTTGDAWNLLEVKSSTRLKEVNLNDIAVQTFCLEAAGIELDRLELVHIDTGYVRDGAVDPERLFHREDVTDLVRARLDAVGPEVERMHVILDGPEPTVPIGPHCSDPYDCPLKAQCWADVPADSVTTMHRAGRRAFDWMDRGWMRVDDLPEDQLDSKQRIQREALRSGAMQVDRPALRTWLDQIQYPLLMLDFEAFAAAAPRLDGTRPYEAVPFQVSVHVIESQGAAPSHLEFIASEPTDPRPALAEFLAALPTVGSVMAWHASYELRILRSLAEANSTSAAELLDLCRRMIDLEDPFKRFDIYHPAQRGRTSIKLVLPALTGTSYEGDAIENGSEAAGAYLRAVHGWPGPAQIDAFEVGEVVENLRRYCEKDTYSMVEVLRVLEGLV